VGALHPFADLFDAAIRHSSVRVTCPRCRRRVVFATAALWYLFSRNGWNDRFGHVRRRLCCRVCYHHGGTKERPRLEFGDEPLTDTRLRMPTRADWAREARRRR